MAENSEASAKAGPGDHCSDPGSYTKNGLNKQRIAAAPVHLIGNPKVRVERRNGSAFVVLENRPWGWPDANREFLDASSPMVPGYVARLRLKLAEAAWGEFARRARIKAARQRGGAL